MRSSAAIGLATAAVAFAGCGGGDTGPGPLPRGELVSLTRSGRAPFDDQTIVLRGDRHAILSNRDGFHVISVEAGIVEALGRELHRSHFSKLSPREDRIPGPDAARYAITYRGRTVRVSEGSVPSALKNTVSSLTTLLPGVVARPIDIFLEVRRRGGFAPTEMTVYVKNDGDAYEFETGGRRRARHYRLRPDALAALKQAVVQMRLADVRSSNVPPPADGYVYEVTADSSDPIRAPQGKVPPPLARVIALAESRARSTVH